MSIVHQTSAVESANTHLPVIELFRTETRREIVRYVVTEVHHDPFRQADIANQINVSCESLRQHRRPLEELGILYCLTDEQKPIPHYRPADTDVVRLLRAGPLGALITLFETSGSRELVDFFLTTADPGISYSLNQIGEKGGPQYQGASNNIPHLVDTRLVTEVDGPRATEYRVNTDSDTYRFLVRLNNTIDATHE